MTLKELINRKRIVIFQLELMRQEEIELVKQFGRKGYQYRIDIALDSLFDVKQRILKLNNNKKNDEKEL